MELSYSLLVGFLAVLLVLITTLIHMLSITRIVSGWITWYFDIMYLRSLPCPPKHWLWGHAFKVSTQKLVTNQLLLYTYGKMERL